MKLLIDVMEKLLSYNIEYGEWSSWSECNARQCGEIGEKTRTREVSYILDGLKCKIIEMRMSQPTPISIVLCLINSNKNLARI